MRATQMAGGAQGKGVHPSGKSRYQTEINTQNPVKGLIWDSQWETIHDYVSSVALTQRPQHRQRH